MNSSSLAKRYLPLAAVIAVQVLIIALFPSKSNTSNVAVGSGPVQGYSSGAGAPGSFSGGAAGGGGSGAGAGAVGTASSGAGGAVAGRAGAGTLGGASGSTTGGATGAGGTTGTGAGSATGSTAASTAHCASGREFDPSIDYYAPPCTPGPIGGTYNNGGSTWQGVSANQVTLVDYISNYGAEVNTILQAQGLLETYQQGLVLDKAYQNFINSHYVLWGRQAHIVTYQGTCQSVPPDTACLQAEMDTIVRTYHPYAVFWNTTLCSTCYARLAQDHTIGFGGDGFSDAFAQANAPYFWSGFESSTHIEQGFARWWCNQMTSNNSSRVVTYAQPKNPAQNFNGKKRVLGVISTNDPDNEDTVSNVLVPALNRDCGDGGSISQHHYYYAQDINTAAQQTNAGISAMDTTSNPATDVLCLCDSVAPEFLYQGEEQHNYWPENVLADVQGMTYDAASQNYEASGNQSSLACPTPSVGCEFDNAFGVMSTAAQDPQSRDASVKVFKLGGGQTMPITALAASQVWLNFNMMASLIENTGPDLTPARMAAAAPSMGTIGGGTTGHYEVGFSAGNYNWSQDARVAYWDKNKVSPYNNQPGMYVSIEGSRFLPNGYPVLTEPPIPAVRPS